MPRYLLLPSEMLQWTPFLMSLNLLGSGREFTIPSLGIILKVATKWNEVCLQNLALSLRWVGRFVWFMFSSVGPVELFKQLGGIFNAILQAFDPWTDAFSRWPDCLKPRLVLKVIAELGLGNDSVAHWWSDCLMLNDGLHLLSSVSQSHLS